MRLFRSSAVLGIASDALEFARKASEETHPDEYMGLLRGEDARRVGLDRSGTVITEVLIVPGTQSTPTSATVDSNMIPNDRHAVGSIHSHPNGVLKPSDTDRNTFGKGRVHIIMGHPYGVNDWAAFDQQGSRRSLEILDVDLPDPEDFFDFDETDLDIDNTQKSADDDSRWDIEMGTDTSLNQQADENTDADIHTDTDNDQGWR
ncbi:MAG: putative metal-dependent protease of the PAD1/JAB1 superfamily [Haloquadratum walsbyi J07HQW2]|jgi:proteasome Rpn11 subunit JAMM motif . Metallo peptidase. MEROPS family M67B|uniref:Putative metal-dependent protease of the PAD1/JAB1 superfamily n=1 Tax=Haloquadratum walsbyi J07HQW2 TaxID=1238425 RepID=U1PS29_9EURY|nr:MAG: putative metal-dependent protease of the PAD1/JAB1 superfamily [Haloquadratum walsbyi J07HQW2]